MKPASVPDELAAELDDAGLLATWK